MTATDFTTEEIKRERHKLSQLVMMDRVYLPIFERLEKELETREHADAMFERAKAIAYG